MKKIIRFFSICLVAVLTITGSQTFLGADENWSGTASSSHYTISDGVITSDDSFIFLGPDNIGESETNYFVTDEYDTTGDYTISVNTKGTMNLPNDHEVKIGVVPYYLDEDNFLYVYVHWAADERPTDVRCVQFSGLMNGQPIELFDALNMEYLQSKWNDCWCDGIQVAAAEELTIEVDKTNAGDNVVFSYVVSYAGGVIGSGEYTLDADHFAEAGKVGVMACGEATTFSNFTFTEIVDEPETENPKETEKETENNKGTENNKETENLNSENNSQTSDDNKTDPFPTPIVVGIVVILVVVIGVVAVLLSKKKK